VLGGFLAESGLIAAVIPLRMAGSTEAAITLVAVAGSFLVFAPVAWWLARPLARPRPRYAFGAGDLLRGPCAQGRGRCGRRVAGGAGSRSERAVDRNDRLGLHNPGPPPARFGDPAANKCPMLNAQCDGEDDFMCIEALSIVLQADAALARPVYGDGGVGCRA
jgi:hypothetical protein